MPRDAYLIVRDFRVWFEKRRGFLRALRHAEPDYIRAVDGIDLDIGRGEMFCLVGESGCGKTTTGKGILKLVEPTDGDVFVNVPAPVLAQYEAARTSGDGPALEAIRRRHSLAWKERRPWTIWDVIVLALVFLGAAVVATVIPALLFVLPPVQGSGLFGVLWTAVVPPLLLAILATTPPARPTSRIVLPIGLASLAAFSVASFLGLVFGGNPDPGLTFQTVTWGTAARASIGGSLVAFLLGVSLAQILMLERLRTAGLEGIKIRGLRRKLQIIFQDPYESLNPKHSVYDIVAEPLIVNGLTASRAETESLVERALDDAGLRPPRDFLFRYPHELSGGQRQRVSIAGALVLDPEFLVADEPVSMLDVSIRTEILELLQELRAKKGLTFLFITHDLSLAWVVADRIGVMYLGKIVEEGPTRELIKNPRHPYTKALISVVPVPDPDRRRERIILRGERPDPSDIPAGCRFHPRCPVAFERCGWTAEEVMSELRGLASDDMERATIATATVQSPVSFTVPSAPPELEARLRQLVEAHGESVRALKAIQTIERAEEGLRVSLHEFSEPELRPISTDVKVSCHLFS